ILQMLRELFNNLGLARRRKLQARQPLSDFFFPLRHGRLTVLLDGSRLFPGAFLQFAPQLFYFGRQVSAQFEATGEVAIRFGDTAEPQISRPATGQRIGATRSELKSPTA